MDKNTIFKNQVIWSLVIRGGGIFITLIQVPLLLGILEQEKYGVWLTLLNVVNWVTVFDLGITNGLRNKLSELFVQQKFDDTRKYIFNVFLFLTIFFVSIYAVFFLFQNHLNYQKLFNTKTIENDELSLIFNLVFSGIIFRYIIQTPIVLETARGFTHISNGLLLFGNSLSLISIFILSVVNKSYLNLTSVGIISIWIPNLVYVGYFVWFIFKDNGFFMPKISEINILSIRPLMKISFHFFLIQITALIIFASLPFLLTQLLNPNSATEYNLANSIFNIPLLIMGVLCNPITPLVTQAYVQKDKVWLVSILKKFYIYTAVLLLVIWMLYAFSNRIYYLWIGNKVTINNYLVLWIAIYTSINIILQPFSNIYNGIGKLDVIAYLSPVGVILFLTTSIYFTQQLQNPTGVVIGLISSSLIGLIYIPYKVFFEIKYLD